MRNLLDKITEFFRIVRPLTSDRVKPYFDDPEHKELITNKIIELRNSKYKRRSIKYNYKNEIYEIRPVLP